MTDEQGDTDSGPAPERHEDWPKLLEWIEKQAQESLKARFVTCELISKEAQTTLTVVLAGIGGSAAYASKLLEPGPAGPAAVAFAAACAYLVVLAVLLVCFCLMFQSYPALYQDPANLLHPQHSLDDVRLAEIENIEARIAEARSINELRAGRLNKLRLATALTPAVFLLAAVATPAPRAPQPSSLEVACSVEPGASAASATLRCKYQR